MFDQSLLQSGFDAEALLGPRYLRYLLLSSVETGALPMRVSIPDPALEIIVRPPEDYQRLYEPYPDAEPLPPPVADGAFDTEILFAHDSGADLRVRMIVEIPPGDDGNQLPLQFIDLFVTVSLETVTDAGGIPSGARLRLEVVALELDGLLALALAVAGKTPEDILPNVKQVVDRSIDLGLIGQGQRVQRIAMRKHERSGDHPAAVGFYMNFRLRNGPQPDAYLEDRGDLDQARNFLPAEDDLAFGMPGSLYARLGDDARFRMAEETQPGSGEFHFPLREDPSDRNSDEKGKIKDITVSALAGNVLRIDVHGEFFVDFLPDPDFHFKFDLTPSIDNGLLSFSLDHDLDVDLLGSLLIAVAIVGLVFSLGTAGFMAFVILAVQELLVEPIILAPVGERAEESFDASFLDALPHRVTAERRRWDPLYTTKHQLVALLEAIQINDAGIGFSGRAVLDKEPEPIPHAVIRDEARDNRGAITELWYRVQDIQGIGPDLTAAFPGTDRRAFERVTGDLEPDLVRITQEQVRERLAERRVLDRIGYVPKKVHVVDNQIRLLLCISETELAEQRGRLLREFRDRTRAEILQDQGDALREEIRQELEAELGQPPTDEQVEQALENRLATLVAEAEAPFVENELPGLLNDALDPLLRFDLDAPEFFTLEDDRVLFIRGYQRIRMVRDGRVSEYYRDQPDGVERDNLLSLPRYVPAGP